MCNKIETYLSILFQIYSMDNLHEEIMKRESQYGGGPIECYIKNENGMFCIYFFKDGKKDSEGIKIDFNRLNEMRHENIEMRNKLERIKETISLTIEM